jgi:hypothetical protein
MESPAMRKNSEHEEIAAVGLDQIKEQPHTSHRPNTLADN